MLVPLIALVVVIVGVVIYISSQGKNKDKGNRPVDE